MKQIWRNISKNKIDSSFPEIDTNEKKKKRRCIEINFANLSTDPELRHQISNYDPNVEDQVRKAFMQKGHC